LRTHSITQSPSLLDALGTEAFALENNTALYAKVPANSWWPDNLPDNTQVNH